MRLHIEDFCIRCQICVSLYPDLFKYDLDRDAMSTSVDELSEEMLNTAKSAIRDCAVTAIVLRK